MLIMHRLQDYFSCPIFSDQYWTILYILEENEVLKDRDFDLQHTNVQLQI